MVLCIKTPKPYTLCIRSAQLSPTNQAQVQLMLWCVGPLLKLVAQGTQMDGAKLANKEIHFT